MNKVPTRQRNPDITRGRILKAAYQEMYRHGFQGMRIDEVLDRTGLKKGALYHHFPSKLALGYAVLDELIAGLIENLWLEPLESYDDPVAGLEDVLIRMGRRISSEQVSLGCPLNNLAQEMSPVDEGFRSRVERVFARWVDGLERALRHGQHQGFVEATVDARTAARFIVAAVEGCTGLAKSRKSADTFCSCANELKRYLRTLRRQSQTGTDGLWAREHAERDARPGTVMAVEPIRA